MTEVATSVDQQQQLMNDMTNNQANQKTRRAQNLAEFYRGKTIFVTGATGFVGKVCMVKLVASLPDCKRIYVMLRSKRGLTPQQRFTKMLQEEPFAEPAPLPSSSSSSAFVDPSLPKPREKPLDWSKVVAIEGDMSSPELGLSAEVRDQLSREVNIVFNIAASVQFDAPLKQNLRDNYMGTRNLLQLATQFEKLISFVHVSTFFANCHQSHIEEEVVPMNRDCEKMAELISWMPDSLCDKMAPHLLESRPNTYVFTKAMSENLCLKYQGRLPLAIVRPSIVTPSVKDPVPGWVDNVNGPMGLGILASLGILRNIDWNYWGVADFIPVDTFVNSMLAVAERTHRLSEQEKSKEILVYNCSSGTIKPVTWGECFEILRLESLKAPPYKMLRVPIDVPKHKRANKIGFAFTKLSELLFAYFVDFILMIFGQKQILTKLTAKLHHGYEILLPFTTNQFTCSNENLLAAQEELQAEDQDEFNFNINQLDLPEAFRVSYYGARRRLLKEHTSNIPAAIFKMRILIAVEFVFKILFWCLVGWTSLKLYRWASPEIGQLNSLG